MHRLAGGSFDYEDLGEQTLKGIAQPTHAYRIVGVSEAASRFEAATQEGLTPLVGREQEIGLLLERWAAGARRRRPGGAALRRAGHRQEPHPECAARAAGSARARRRCASSARPTTSTAPSGPASTTSSGR